MTLRRIGQSASLDARSPGGRLSALYAQWVAASDAHAGRVRGAHTGAQPATSDELRSLQREAREAWHLFQSELVRARLEGVEPRGGGVAPGGDGTPRAVAS